MRTNVYSQELITAYEDRPFAYVEDGKAVKRLPITELITQEADTGVTYSGVRLYLHSPERLHARGDDDDRSALTFWLPASAERRGAIADSFEQMAKLVREAPAETGLD